MCPAYTTSVEYPSVQVIRIASIQHCLIQMNKMANKETTNGNRKYMNKNKKRKYMNKNKKDKIN